MVNIVYTLYRNIEGKHGEEYAFRLPMFSLFVVDNKKAQKYLLIGFEGHFEYNVDHVCVHYFGSSYDVKVPPYYVTVLMFSEMECPFIVVLVPLTQAPHRSHIDNTNAFTL